MTKEDLLHQMRLRVVRDIEGCIEQMEDLSSAEKLWITQELKNHIILTSAKSSTSPLRKTVEKYALDLLAIVEKEIRNAS